MSNGFACPVKLTRIPGHNTQHDLKHQDHHKCRDSLLTVGTEPSPGGTGEWDPDVIQLTKVVEVQIWLAREWLERWWRLRWMALEEKNSPQLLELIIGSLC